MVTAVSWFIEQVIDYHPSTPSHMNCVIYVGYKCVATAISGFIEQVDSTIKGIFQNTIIINPLTSPSSSKELYSRDTCLLTDHNLTVMHSCLLLQGCVISICQSVYTQSVPDNIMVSLHINANYISYLLQSVE